MTMLTVDNGAQIATNTVVITTGTFLKGEIHVGKTQWSSFKTHGLGTFREKIISGRKDWRSTLIWHIRSLGFDQFQTRKDEDG
jgi:hypothetical protein